MVSYVSHFGVITNDAVGGQYHKYYRKKHGDFSHSSAYTYGGNQWKIHRIIRVHLSLAVNSSREATCRLIDSLFTLEAGSDGSYISIYSKLCANDRNQSPAGTSLIVLSVVFRVVVT